MNAGPPCRAPPHRGVRYILAASVGIVCGPNAAAAGTYDFGLSMF